MLEVQKAKKKNKYILIISLLVLIILVSWLGIYLSDKNGINLANKNQNKEQNVASYIKEGTNVSEEHIDVLSLGKTPFKNDKNTTFHSVSIETIKNLKEPAIIIANKDFLKDNNKDLFITLAKSDHTILFYSEKITPEEVVLYFDGLVPVVPIESTLPLNYQAYGVTTLNNNIIPIFVSATTDQTQISEESFKELFNQISDGD